MVQRAATHVQASRCDAAHRGWLPMRHQHTRFAAQGMERSQDAILRPEPVLQIRTMLAPPMSPAKLAMGNVFHTFERWALWMEKMAQLRTLRQTGLGRRIA